MGDCICDKATKVRSIEYPVLRMKGDGLESRGPFSPTLRGSSRGAILALVRRMGSYDCA